MIFINFTLISFVKIFKKITFLKSQARIFVAKVKKKAKFAFHSVCVASLWPKKGTFSSVEISFRCWFITNVSVDIGVGTHKLWRCWKQSLCLTFYSKGFFLKKFFLGWWSLAEKKNFVVNTGLEVVVRWGIQRDICAKS